MNHLVADEGLVDRLRGLLEPVEIRDASGKILGHFTPVVSPEERARYEKLEGLFDLEEAERAIAANEPGRTLKEIMEELRSLENRGCAAP